MGWAQGPRDRWQGLGYLGGALWAISSNDATTLTVAAFGFTPDTTTCYEILDNFGVCTGGTATTLVDSTQNWRNTGTYGEVTGKRVKITAGASVGTEYTITGATSGTTLTYASGITTTTDNTYTVLGVSPRGTGCCLVRVSGNGPANRRHKLVSFRGGATATIDIYDIANNVWDVLSQVPLTETFTSGTMYAYNNTNRIYFQKDGTGKTYFLDLTTNRIVPVGTLPYVQGAALMGDKIFVLSTTDLAAENLEYVYQLRHTAADFFRVLVYT